MLTANQLLQAQNLIADNRILPAINFLKNSINDSVLINQLVLLEARWNRIIMQEGGNLLSSETAELQKNQIINALLTIISKQQHKSGIIAPSKQSVIVEIDKTFHDFKTVKKSSSSYKREIFKVKNIGEKELVISNIFTSSPSEVNAQILNRQIPPKSSTDIIVEFYPKEVGKQFELITIEANTQPQHTVIAVAAEVKNNISPILLSLALITLLVLFGGLWCYINPGCPIGKQYCTPSPCFNGGKCHKDGKCNCDGTGYKGERCEISLCVPNPCLNGGKCHGDGKCDCKNTGYKGERCEISLCKDINCLNEGTCDNGKCKCQNGYSGKVCQNINLMDLAKSASWTTSKLCKKGTSNCSGHEGESGSGSKLKFNVDGGENGNAKISSGILEDGTQQRFLHMHPKWTERGSIRGWFRMIKYNTLPPNPRFKAKVGFSKGAEKTDGVTFWVWIHYYQGSKERWKGEKLTKKYTGKLEQFDIDLSPYGDKIYIELRVDAGSSSGQDWAVWINPRIEGK